MLTVPECKCVVNDTALKANVVRTGWRIVNDSTKPTYVSCTHLLKPDLCFLRWYTSIPVMIQSASVPAPSPVPTSALILWGSSCRFFSSKLYFCQQPPAACNGLSYVLIVTTRECDVSPEKSMMGAQHVLQPNTSRTTESRSLQ